MPPGTKTVNFGITQQEVQVGVAGERAGHGIRDGEHRNIPDVGVGHHIDHGLGIFGKADSNEQVIGANGGNLLREHAADRIQEMASIFESKPVRKPGKQRPEMPCVVQ